MTQARYVILPADNRFNWRMHSPSLDLWRSDGMASAAVAVATPAAARPGGARAAPRVPPLGNVISRIGDEALLVSLDDAQRLALRRELPGLTIIEEGTAQMAMMQGEILPIPEDGMAAAGGPARELVVSVRDPAGKPLARRTVFALTDLTTHPPTGAQGKTNGKGVARLLLPAKAKVARVVVEPAPRYWAASWSHRGGKQPSALTLVSRPVDPAEPDGLRRLRAAGAAEDGAGVTVAVIDGGATHPALHVAGGLQLTGGEPKKGWEDNGVGHGTHVAGIIAAQPGHGVPAGLAPGVKLLVYRVYAKGARQTGSFAVSAAIHQAVNDGADLINLSFTLNDLDARPTEREIKRARAMGAVCVAAAGNKGGAVAFPARFPSAVGVSAIGVRDGVPEGADEFQIGSSPRAKGHRNLGVATFSCRGPEVDFTAPGVGVVSLLPGAFGPMSGTSMAAPAFTGLLARRLARDAELLGSARDQARSDGIVKLAASIATSVGLPASWEGHGLLPG